MRLNTFQKWALATLIAVVFLIFIGGLVRAAGAGLGCPDWPKCWGVWIPPSSIDQVDLPSVLEQFREKDPSLTQEDLVVLFEPLKIWVEYLNRLLGVLVGLLVLGTFFLSFGYRKSKPAVFWGALLAVILVVFQGWLGGQVVKSGLQAGMITLHMFLAIVLFCVLLFVMHRASAELLRVEVDDSSYRRWKLLALGFFILCAVQIVIGSQVREAIDGISGSHGRDESQRGTWLAQVGQIDHVHRAFAWSLVAGALMIAVAAVRSHFATVGRWLAFGLLGTVGLQVVLGICLAYFGLPRGAQVLHLGVSSIIVCLSFVLFLALGRRRVLVA